MAATKKAGSKKKTVVKKTTTTKSSTTQKAVTSQSSVKSDVAKYADFEPYQSKKGEEYMGDAQLTHFREILLAWKRGLMEEVDRTVHHMKDEVTNFPDPNDRATQEEEFSLELRTRDRERKLIKKIDESLEQIDNEEYGYCEFVIEQRFSTQPLSKRLC